MAKVGYIFLAEGYDTYEADIQWMKEYGCVRIIEEKTANERLRPDWRQLLMTLERGDVLVQLLSIVDVHVIVCIVGLDSGIRTALISQFEEFRQPLIRAGNRYGIGIEILVGEKIIGGGPVGGGCQCDQRMDTVALTAAEVIGKILW